MAKNKYHSKKIEVDGIVFDSRKEARRWNELKMLEKAGEIHNLERQVKFVLIPSQKIDGKVVERACSYVADFVYEVYDTTMIKIKVVEDTKGFKTKDYIIKRKLMLYKYAIQIHEV